MGLTATITMSSQHHALVKYDLNPRANIFRTISMKNTMVKILSSCGSAYCTHTWSSLYLSSAAFRTSNSVFVESAKERKKLKFTSGNYLFLRKIKPRNNGSQRDKDSKIVVYRLHLSEILFP